jgi:hypothetical protein
MSMIPMGNPDLNQEVARLTLAGDLGIVRVFVSEDPPLVMTLLVYEGNHSGNYKEFVFPIPPEVEDLDKVSMLTIGDRPPYLYALYLKLRRGGWRAVMPRKLRENSWRFKLRPTPDDIPF